jgi:hypothetical protein
VKNVDFFPDWFLLTQCDILAISNSTFSFTAAMFSEYGDQFFRPTFEDEGLIPFDPWNSEPMLFAPHEPRILDEYRKRHQYQEPVFDRLSRSVNFLIIAASYLGLLFARGYVCVRCQGWASLLKAMLTTKFYLKPRVRYDE